MKNYKLECEKLICKYDNKNQTDIMKKNISKSRYDMNRTLIHKYYITIENKEFISLNMYKKVLRVLVNGTLNHNNKIKLTGYKKPLNEKTIKYMKYNKYIKERL